MASTDDLDSPWKEILERLFEPFMAFFFPNAHADIDWTRGYQCLDKELQSVLGNAVSGRRIADKLIRVWRRNGSEAWVLIHVEIQGRREPGFPRRMYVYNYRIFDRYDRAVVSVAVLADGSPGWRPDRFESGLWGCRAGLQFPVVKLLDYVPRRKELEANPNPFAMVVLAHLDALDTARSPDARYNQKRALLRLLLRSGKDRAEVADLLRFIDWVLRLPDDLTARLRTEVAQWPEVRTMPYVTSWERLAEKKGLETGRENATRSNVLSVLAARFGRVPARVQAALKREHDVERLSDLVVKAAVDESLAAFAARLKKARK